MNQNTPASPQMHAWLKIFAVSARHLSFTLAAEELHVTTGAVSQQIKRLEERLGYRLFQRLPRRLELTVEGRRLADVVDNAHRTMDLELLRLDSGEMSGIVRVRAVPSFLTKWLAPRLPRLQARYPALALHLQAEDSTLSLRAAEFDLAIDLNDGSYPGFQTTPLMEEEIFPVCTPALMQGRSPLRSPADLDDYPLLHDVTAWRGSDRYAEWAYYLKAISAPQVEIRRGYTFNRNHLTIDAAIAGMGVAIARRTLITDELESGLLVAPFSQRVATGKRYGIVHLAGALDDRRVAAVHDWITEEAHSNAP